MSRASEILEKQFDPKKIAREILSGIEDAVGDMASAYWGFDNKPTGYDPFDKWGKMAAKAAKSGVRDVLGWLADEMYSDPQLVQDLIGDQVYDKSNDIPAKAIAILTEMKKGAQSAVKIACDKLIKSWKDRGKKSKVKSKAPKEDLTKAEWWYVSDKVRHPTFGDGVVTDVSFNKNYVEIKFKRGGKKMIDVGVVKLTKI